MRKMYSQKQIQNMVLNSIEGFDEVVINGDLEVKGDLTAENVKPIYCHPIIIYKYNLCVLTCLIFNNSETPFSTWSGFLTYIRSWGLDTARIMFSGGYINSGNDVIASSMDITEDSVTLAGVSNHETTNVSITSQFDDVLLIDSPNKLN